MHNGLDSALPSVPFQECSLEAPGRNHFCQIHQDESSLTAAALRYLQLGAVGNDNLMLITSAKRLEQITSWLAAAGIDVARLREKRRLFTHTSQQILETVFVDDVPDPDAFRTAATRMIAEATWDGKKRLRFYGDAVSDLWAVGNHAAAVDLEAAWVRFKAENSFDVSYFCGYVIDALSPRSYSDHLSHLGRTHCFVMSSKDSLALAGALDRAGREVLGVTMSAALSRKRGSQWDERLPFVFQAVMWLRHAHPTATERVLARAKAIYDA